MNKAEQVVNFFKGHPKFPFLNWYTDYDEYCAMYLCITNILKSYIGKNYYSEWDVACGYVDFRRDKDSGIVSFPLSCLNVELEIVIFLAISQVEDKKQDDFYYIHINQSDRWGGRWEYNAPQEEWFKQIAIMFDLETKDSLRKLDILLTKVLEKKYSFDEIQVFENLN